MVLCQAVRSSALAPPLGPVLPRAELSPPASQVLAWPRAQQVERLLVLLAEALRSPQPARTLSAP
jgi:hypothetical protein